MPDGSIIPPDIQKTMKQRGTGIGGGAPENAVAARARAVAIDPASAVEEEAEAAAAEAAASTEELKTCPSCKAELKDEWNFCAKCGADLIRGGAAKKLGVEFTEKDLEDYIFKGYILREVKLLGGHAMLLKSAQPKDVALADDYMMNGSWRKGKDGQEKAVSEFYSRQINQLCMTATTVQKLDGKSIGDKFEDKMAWFEERGSAMVDMISSKVILFNKAITDFLGKADAVKGS